jgi:hypothetical protein
VSTSSEALGIEEFSERIDRMFAEEASVTEAIGPLRRLLRSGEIERRIAQSLQWLSRNGAPPLDVLTADRFVVRRGERWTLYLDVFLGPGAPSVLQSTRRDSIVAALRGLVVNVATYRQAVEPDRPVQLVPNGETTVTHESMLHLRAGIDVATLTSENSFPTAWVRLESLQSERELQHFGAEDGALLGAADTDRDVVRTLRLMRLVREFELDGCRAEIELLREHQSPVVAAFADHICERANGA